jgi:hypothetical protein
MDIFRNGHRTCGLFASQKNGATETRGQDSLRRESSRRNSSLQPWRKLSILDVLFTPELPVSRSLIQIKPPHGLPCESTLLVQRTPPSWSHPSLTNMKRSVFAFCMPTNNPPSRKGAFFFPRSGYLQDRPACFYASSLFLHAFFP